MCLHFVWGLNDEQYGNVKHKLLQKAEQKCTLEELIEETEKVRLSQKAYKVNEEVVAEVKHFRNNSRDFLAKEIERYLKGKALVSIAEKWDIMQQLVGQEEVQLLTGMQEGMIAQVQRASDAMQMAHYKLTIIIIIIIKEKSQSILQTQPGTASEEK